MSRVLFLASWRRMKGGQTLLKSSPSPPPLQTKKQFLPVGGLMAADPMETSLQASLAGQHKPWGKSVSPAEEQPILGPGCLVATLLIGKAGTVGGPVGYNFIVSSRKEKMRISKWLLLLWVGWLLSPSYKNAWRSTPVRRCGNKDKLVRPESLPPLVCDVCRAGEWKA